jgi:hypothetical protein
MVVVVGQMECRKASFVSDFYGDLVLGYCADDYTGLWLIVAELRDRSGGAIDDRGILDILYGLLKEGQIQAGFPTHDGRGFEPWPSSPEETISRIEREWRQLGREPDIGEIVWLNAPGPATP